MDAVYLMRVPKTGSQALSHMSRILSKLNNFHVVQRPVTNNFAILKTHIQKEFAEDVYDEDKPLVFSGMHEHYIDFTQFDMPQPIYISLVRDPVEKVISWYYYARSNLFNALNHKSLKKQIETEGSYNWYRKTYENCVLSGDPECQYRPLGVFQNADYRIISAQFCGMHPNCVIFNSKNSVQRAKENVEKRFAVVGSWEDANITLTVLEHYVPRFYKGALSLYYAQYNDIANTNRNEFRAKISEHVKDLVRKNFTHEIDFYNFCKQRLYKQYLAITLNDLD